MRKVYVPSIDVRYLSLLLIYAPILTTKEENITSFYTTLGDVIRSIPTEEKLIVLGDFIARVGKQHGAWEALGSYGIGEMNSNGLYLEFCSWFDLVINNSFFRPKEKHKVPGFIPDRSKVI